MRLRLFFVFFVVTASAIIFISPAFADGEAGAGEESVGKLKVRAFPSAVHIGDEIRLVIQTELPKGLSIQPISPKVNFSPFELISIDKPYVAYKEHGVLQTVIIRLRLFRMGDFQIPSIPVNVWNMKAEHIQAQTPPVPVRVVSIGKAKGDQGDIRPIKGFASVSLQLIYNGILGGVAFLLMIFLVVKIILRRKKTSDLESLLPPHERLLRELQRLRDQQWLSGGHNKEYYSELSDILRRYLERRFNLEIMEHTSAEVSALLKTKNFSESLIAEIREILEKSDLVKFARFIPERNLALELEGRLVRIAEETKPAEKEDPKKSKGKKK